MRLFANEETGEHLCAHGRRVRRGVALRRGFFLQ
jgi:hypothetical protein